jgi:hypothetical protein
MEFRDALGVSRKYAVPILDYFDRIRLTVRTGHDRTPGVEARKALKSPRERPRAARGKGGQPACAVCQGSGGGLLRGPPRPP